MKLSQIANDAAEAEKEAETQSAGRLSAIAAEKEQQRILDIGRRAAEANSVMAYEFTLEELAEMGEDPMADLDNMISDDRTDGERQEEQKEDEAEEKLQIQDELNRAQRDIAKLREVVSPPSPTRLPPPSPRLPLPNPLPTLHPPPPILPAPLPERPRPTRWVPPLPTSSHATSPSPSASTKASPKCSLTPTTLLTLPSPSSSSSRSRSLEHSSAPAWVLAAATYLSEPALGKTWAECVERWLTLGQQTEYNDKVRN